MRFCTYFNKYVVKEGFPEVVLEEDIDIIHLTIFIELENREKY
jgi:hypothetical protein